MTNDMHRFAAGLCALVCALALPTSALAAHRSSTAPTVSGIAAGAASGIVTAVNGSTLTIQTNGRRMGVINALVAAADQVTKGDYPYVWGGGHAIAGVASVGIRGPGYNGRRRGLDCSGSVAAVLTGGGLWPAGASVPSDAGVIAELRAQGLIARGAGTAPSEVTLYDDPGVHIFMNIDGHFFGTSDGGGGNPSQRNGGAGWLNDSAWDATSRSFHRWHVVSSVLHDRTTYGHSYTFVIDPTISAFSTFTVGDKVRVNYSETKSGSLLATNVTFHAAQVATGTVLAVAPDGSSVTIQTASGASETLAIPAGLAADLGGSVVLGDTVEIRYTTQAGIMTARDLIIAAAPVPVPTPPTTPAPTTTSPTSTGDPTSTSSSNPSPGSNGNGYVYEHSRHRR